MSQSLCANQFCWAVAVGLRKLGPGGVNGSVFDLIPKRTLSGKGKGRGNAELEVPWTTHTHQVEKVITLKTVFLHPEQSMSIQDSWYYLQAPLWSWY